LVGGGLVIKPHVERYYAESFMEASIPDDAKHVRISYFSWQGQSLLVKLELSPASLSEFLTKLGLSQSQLEDGHNPHQLSHGKPDWWNSDRAEVFDGAEWRRSPNAGKVYKIVVEKSSPVRYTIYLSVDEG
jgi:hypothetical protein